MSLVALMMMAIAGDDAAEALDRYRQLTRADIRCGATADRDEITVCGARDADRFRLRFVVAEAGDPRAEGVPDERARLTRRSNPCQEAAAILVGCGAVGVTASTSFGPGANGRVRLRGFAP